MLGSPRLQRPVFSLLRCLVPVLRIGSTVVVTQNADGVDVLRRNSEFTLAALNGPRMRRWNGDFILGMDGGPDYERELAALRRAAPGDLTAVAAFVADTAAGLVEAVRPSGRLDVVGQLARVVPARVVATIYGVPGPDEATTMRWMRALFDAVFLDDGPRARKAAELTVAEQRPYMARLIAGRRSALAAGDDVPDDMLTRLVAMGAAESWLDDDAVRRNINGVIVGALETTAKTVTLVVDELLRRPSALATARAAALTGDIDAVRQHAWEALRFLPHGPLLERHATQATTIGPRQRPVPAGALVLVVTASAMFDSAAFPDPNSFRADRPLDSYLHFGHGLHTCFGLAVNQVQIPELVAAVLRLPGLRRAPGPAGRLSWDGPFPDRLVVEFDG